VSQTKQNDIILDLITCFSWIRDCEPLPETGSKIGDQIVT
jgi:hypothetical protein